MKRFVNFSTVLLAALLFITVSCDEKITIDLPPGKQMLVVDGWITNADTVQTVRLFYTDGYFSNAALPAVTGAEVIVHDDSAQSITFTETAPGIYQSAFSGIPGHVYYLEINLADGSGYLSAKELLEASPAIDSIYTSLAVPNPSPRDSGRVYSVLIDTKEAPGYGDYYRFREIINGEEQTGPYDIYLANDEFVNGQPILGFDVFGNRYRLNDTVCVIQEKISEAASDFLTEVQQQTAFVGGPFDPPPAPITGNIYNKNNPSEHALGFFAAAGRRQACIVVGE